MWHGQAVTFNQENNQFSNDTPKLKLNAPEINLLTINSSTGNYKLSEKYMCFLVPTHMTRISDCSTTTSSKLYLSELEHLLLLNHYQNFKNFRLHSNLSKKNFWLSSQLNFSLNL